jgi:hypothetical protein
VNYRPIPKAIIKIDFIQDRLSFGTYTAMRRGAARWAMVRSGAMVTVLYGGSSNDEQICDADGLSFLLVCGIGSGGSNEILGV